MVRSAAAMSGRRSSSVEGIATGILGMPPAQQARRDGELGRRPADQHGDGVLELRALDAERRCACASAVENLRCGGGDVAARHRVTGVELIVHDLERSFVLGDGAGEQIEQRIRGAQIEIGGGELRLRRKLGVVEIGGARLRGGGVALDLPAHFAPDVEVPGAADRRRVYASCIAVPQSRADRAAAGGAGERPGPRAGDAVAGGRRRKQRACASRMTARASS